MLIPPKLDERVVTAEDMADAVLLLCWKEGPPVFGTEHICEWGLNKQAI